MDKFAIIVFINTNQQRSYLRALCTSNVTKKKWILNQFNHPCLWSNLSQRNLEIKQMSEALIEKTR